MVSQRSPSFPASTQAHGSSKGAIFNDGSGYLQTLHVAAVYVF